MPTDPIAAATDALHAEEANLRRAAIEHVEATIDYRRAELRSRTSRFGLCMALEAGRKRDNIALPIVVGNRYVVTRDRHGVIDVLEIARHYETTGATPDAD